jgi:hypothetical protein
MSFKIKVWVIDGISRLGGCRIVQMDKSHSVYWFDVFNNGGG